jgi:hypothetical protein
MDRSQLELPCCESYSKPSLVVFPDYDRHQTFEPGVDDSVFLSGHWLDSPSAPVQPVRVGFAPIEGNQ